MPPVSEKQRRAMAAAAHGKSNIGIPKRVGREMMEKDRGGKLPKRAATSPQRPMPTSHGDMSNAEHDRMMGRRVPNEKMKRKQSMPVLRGKSY